MRPYRALIATALLVPAIASAQLLGGRVGADAAVGAPPIGSTLEGTTRTAADATATTVDRAKAPTVSIKAGASTRVDRGTRCYYQPDDYYYDPVYRDGYYYCEQRSSGVGAGASVEAGKPR